MSEELTPRQIAFLKAYTNPKSETFGNAMQSALGVGYGKEYAKNITGQMPEWLSENIRKKKRLLVKAEKALEETLDMDVSFITSEGNVKKDSSLMKIKQDTAKFIASTVGKDEGYSNRTEVTGKNGENLALTAIFDLSQNSNEEDNSKDISGISKVPDFICGVDVESETSTDQERI